MKRKSAALIAAITMVAFAASAALALPQYAQKTGKACTFCHKKPTGGKELTAAGQYYSKNRKLPAAAPAKPAQKPAAAATAKKKAAAPAKKPAAAVSAKKKAPAPAKKAAAAPTKKKTAAPTKKPAAKKTTSKPTAR